jgi:hypothetical protein
MISDFLSPSSRYASRASEIGVPEPIEDAKWSVKFIFSKEVKLGFFEERFNKLLLFSLF